MIDFHSHILPEMDDGSESVEMSLAMLRESQRQGVDLICCTSHFYADEEDPASFLRRRAAAFARLTAAMENPEDYPQILLGAEVLYFPGISGAEEVKGLRLERFPFLLVEPPMMPWTDDMLDEVEDCGKTLQCVPVIAHIDRYMRILHDQTLFERVSGRKLLIQVNASFFLHRDTHEFALECLRRDRFHFIGSDCHNLTNRAPNMGLAAEVIENDGAGDYLKAINDRIYSFLERL